MSSFVHKIRVKSYILNWCQWSSVQGYVDSNESPVTDASSRRILSTAGSQTPVLGCKVLTAWSIQSTMTRHWLRTSRMCMPRTGLTRSRADGSDGRTASVRGQAGSPLGAIPKSYFQDSLQLLRTLEHPSVTEKREYVTAYMRNPSAPETGRSYNQKSSTTLR